MRDIWFQIQDGIQSGKDADTNTVKKHMVDFLYMEPEDETKPISPPLPSNRNKELRGFNHLVTGRMLAPPEDEPFTEEYLQTLIKAHP